jgi:hypothetical protein
MTESAAYVRLIEETSAYWRVLFENPPSNIVDATTQSWTKPKDRLALPIAK